MEIWKEVKGFGGKYLVNEYGDLKSVIKRAGFPKIVKGVISPHGYLWYSVYHSGRNLKRSAAALCAQAFIGDRPKGLTINHKDLNKLNNHFSNLEYLTNRANCLHAIANGRVNIGTRHHNAKLNEHKAKFIYLHPNASLGFLSKKYGICNHSITNVRIGKTWKHVTSKLVNHKKSNQIIRLQYCREKTLSSIKALKEKYDDSHI